MTTRAGTGRASVPACYPGRPAALWPAAPASALTTRRSPRVLRRAIADLTQERKHLCHLAASP
jgi:hypothetical protein